MAQSSEKRNLLDKFMKKDGENLCFHNLRDFRIIQDFESFVKSGKCNSIEILGPINLDVLEKILEILLGVTDMIKVLRMEIWLNRCNRIIDLLKGVLGCHGRLLVDVTLRCSLGADSMAQLLDAIPPGVVALDIAENLLENSLFVKPLINLIRKGNLQYLKLSNCSIKSHVRDDIVKQLLAIQRAFALKTIEGLDLTTCDLHPTLLKALKSPLSKARKACMQPPEYNSRIKSNEGTKFCDYLRGVIFMKMLVGKEVRVWWPPTDEEGKSEFAGRFWPAKVLRVNTIDRIFVVQYDNGEVGNIPHLQVQPPSPFKYGGGLVSPFGPVQRNGPVPHGSTSGIPSPQPTHMSHFFTCANCGYRNLVNCKSRPGDGIRHPHWSLGNSYQNSVSSTEYAETVVDTCGLRGSPLGESTPNQDCEPASRLAQLNHPNVETMFGLGDELSGNVLFPGEFVEFRDVLDVDGSDPSDYVGVIQCVNSREPLYKCVCIYYDGNEEVEVESDNVRRLAILPWYSWVDVSIEVMRGNLAGVCLSDRYRYLGRASPDDSFETPPLNPVDEVGLGLAEYVKGLGEVGKHPRLGASRISQVNGVEERRYQAMVRLKEELEAELQESRRVNEELQRRVNCAVCMQRQKDCILQPCGHFNLCQECANSCKCCPICRGRISKRKLISD